MNRRLFTIGVGTIVGAILGAVGLVWLSEFRNGPLLVGTIWFFLLVALTAGLLRQLIEPHPAMRRYRVAYSALLFILATPLVMQWYVEIGHSFLGAIWWLIPDFKHVIACTLIGALFLTALGFCIKRKFSTALAFFAASAYLAIILPFAVGWTELLVAAERAINDRRGKEIGLAIRAFHDDRGAYPHSLRELRPKYLKSIPWWWDGLLLRPYILGGDEEQCHLKYCSEIGTGRLLGMDNLTWSTDAL